MKDDEGGLGDKWTNRPVQRMLLLTQSHKLLVGRRR